MRATPLRREDTKKRFETAVKCAGYEVRDPLNERVGTEKKVPSTAPERRSIYALGWAPSAGSISCCRCSWWRLTTSAAPPSRPLEKRHPRTISRKSVNGTGRARVQRVAANSG
jgi:hypothetical protein